MVTLSEWVEAHIDADEVGTLPPELRTDPEEIIETIITYDLSGDLVRQLLDNFSDNEEAMLRFIRRKGSLYRYASSRLRRDPEFAKRAIITNPNVFSEVQIQSIQKDPSIFRELVTRGKYDKAITMHPDAKRDEFLYRFLIKKHGSSLWMAPPHLKGDMDAIMTAINNDPETYRLLSDKFKVQASIIESMIEENRVHMVLRQFQDQYLHL